MIEVDDYIEIEDDEVFLGDQHLKLDIPKDNVETKDNNETTNNKSKELALDEIEVDDDILNEKVDVEEVEIADSSTNIEKKENIEKEVDSKNNEDLGENTSEEEVLTNEIAAFGKILLDKGFFPDLEEDLELNKIEDENDLSDILQQQLNVTFKQWADNYKNNLVNNLVSEGYINKNDVQDTLLKAYSEEDIRSNIDTAKEVIRKYYKRTGVPNKEIERIINSRDDLEESAIELNRLNEQLDKKDQEIIAQRLKQQEDNITKQKQEFTETLKKNTFAYQEFIPGKKLKDKDKELIFMNIEPTLQKVNSNLAKYAPLLSYLDNYGILDGNFDKLIKEGKSQGVNHFHELLKEKKRSSNTSNPNKRNNGVINIDDSDINPIYK